MYEYHFYNISLKKKIKHTVASKKLLQYTVPNSTLAPYHTAFDPSLINNKMLTQNVI